MSASSHMFFSEIKMRRYLVVCFVCLIATGIAVADSKDSYRIGPGDMLSITVFGEEDMSLREVRSVRMEPFHSLSSAS